MPLLSREEELTLASAFRERGCLAARDRLIRGNLRFVAHMARRYAGRGLEMHDLVQEGTLGLIRAIQSFDASGASRLTTYAAWWIRLYMERALAQHRPVRIPAYMVTRLGRTAKLQNSVHARSGRSLNAEELQESLGLTVEQQRLVERAIRMARRSMQADRSDRHAPGLWAALPDRRAAAPDEVCAQAETIRMLRQLIDGLSDTQLAVLRHRFGLAGAPRQTYAEVARHLGVSGERARQIAAETLCSLRQHVDGPTTVGRRAPQASN